MIHARRLVGIVHFLTLVLLLSSCATSSVPQRTITAPAPTTSSPPATDGAVSAPGHCEGASGGKQGHMQLVDVSVSDGEQEDRIEFEFVARQGPSDAPPTFELTSVSPPFSTDGAGEPMQVDGEEFFQLIFHGASGFEMDGETPRRTYDGPTELKSDGDVIREAEQSGDFEATLSWIIGLSQHSCPIISELADPPRLVLRFAG